MRAGERQVAPDASGIRRDHTARYHWAAQQLRQLGHHKKVADFACGIGYGANILAAAGNDVHAYDVDAEAIAYGKQHYAHPRLKFHRANGNTPPAIQADAAVCFETLEHIEDPRPLLRALRLGCKTLLASVPNESAFPWWHHKFHFRHYTQSQFQALLAETGWVVTAWHGQASDQSDVEKDLLMGRTLIAKAVRTTLAARATRTTRAKPKKAAPQKLAPRRRPMKGGDAVRSVPKHVAILGLGPSVNAYLEITKRMGGRKKFCDETWGINALGDVFACDRIFHMDDVRIQAIRAKAAPDSNIAALLKWLKTHPGPIITSRAHPDYPGLVEFPLQDVLNKVNGFAYFNSTAAYAVVYAIYLGVEQLTIFGNDFTYENAHHAEKGRACVEYWLGFAAALGIKVTCPKSSSLLDACVAPDERIYGYDTLDVTLQRTSTGTIVSSSPRAALPTAEQIEHRYDHNRHPSPLVDPS